jgi:hypothetical protein
MAESKSRMVTAIHRRIKHISSKCVRLSFLFVTALSAGLNWSTGAEQPLFGQKQPCRVRAGDWPVGEARRYPRKST